MIVNWTELTLDVPYRTARYATSVICGGVGRCRAAFMASWCCRLMSTVNFSPRHRTTGRPVVCCYLINPLRAERRRRRGIMLGDDCCTHLPLRWWMYTAIIEFPTTILTTGMSMESRIRRFVALPCCCIPPCYMYVYASITSPYCTLCIVTYKQEVKVIWQKAPHGGPIPRLGVTPGGRNLYHWIPGVGVPISVP